MKKIICRLLGHRYRLTRRITHSIAELECKRCQSEFGINTDVRALVPLNDELRQLHRDLKKAP
jgi:hypothetical protein